MIPLWVQQLFNEQHPGADMLLESGSFLLLEDGFTLQLEG